MRIGYHTNDMYIHRGGGNFGSMALNNICFSLQLNGTNFPMPQKNCLLCLLSESFHL